MGCSCPRMEGAKLRKLQRSEIFAEKVLVWRKLFKYQYGRGE